MPDISFDTSNYHLYFQEFLTRDFVNYDFFPVRAYNASTLVLGDRMFYLFRYVFGYRMGIMLNTYVIIVVYFQIKNLIQDLFIESNMQISKIAMSVICFICFLTENILTLISTYMVDLLALPLLLEAIRVVCVNKKLEKDEIHIGIFYLCILAGISTAIKMTNIIVLFPIAVIFIFKNYRKIKISHYLVGILIIVGLLFTYLFCSWKITGNPFFPYMNSIFKSPYFSQELTPNDFSGFNNNFGPHNIIEWLFYPIFMVLKPEITSDIPFCTGRLLLVALSGMMYFIYKIKNNEKWGDKEKEISIILVSFYFVFLSIFHGYMRYIIVFELLGSLMTGYQIAFFLAKNKRKSTIFSTCIACLIIEQVLWCGTYCIYRQWEWSWRDIRNRDAVTENMKMIFSDYSSGIQEEILENIESWVLVDASGSLAVNLKKDVPIINLATSVTNDITEEMLQERLENLGEEGIYSISKREEFLGNLSKYSEFGLDVKSILLLQPAFYNSRFCLPLIELEKTEKEEEIEVVQSEELEMTWHIPDDIVELDIFVGDYVDEEKWNNNEYFLNISLLDSRSGNERIEEKKLVKQRGESFHKISIDLSDSDYEQYDTVKIRKEGEMIISEKYMAIFQMKK